MERYLLVEGEFVAALLVTYKPAVGLTLNLGNGGAIIRLSSTKAMSAPRPIRKASRLNIGRALPSRCSVILPLKCHWAENRAIGISRRERFRPGEQALRRCYDLRCD